MILEKLSGRMNASHSIGRWAVVTVSAAASALVLGLAIFVIRSARGPWTEEDVAELVKIGSVIVSVGALSLFVPFTLAASFIPRRSRIALPPVLVLAVGFAVYIRQFGFQPPTWDRPAVTTLIWSALVVGQLVHALLLLGERRSAESAV